MMFKSAALSAIALSIALALSACNDDDNDTNTDANTDTTPTVETGVFIDAPVKGLGFQTASQQGTTNADGEFSYQAGESITFYLDGLELGSAKGAAILPVTMLSNTLDIARILQTLDSDASAELIDVSEAILTDEQKTAIQAVFNNEHHLSAVGLENLVGQIPAAEHLLQFVEKQNWSEALVSGKFFEDVNEIGRVLIKFNDDNTGTFSDTEGDEVFNADTTWELSPEKDTLNLTIISEEGNETIQMKLLGQQEDGTLDIAIYEEEEMGYFITELVPVTE